MRRMIVAGNWKMNMNQKEAERLSKEIAERVGTVTGADVVLCPPFTSLHAVREAIDGSSIALGAQNMHWEEKGAFTGEISSNMLLTAGCNYVILGHSERRSYFGETDDMIARKVVAAIGSGLTPIVCVGETREQREEGITEQVVERQIRGAFGGLSAGDFEGTVIAYEPVWAIGTGLTATAQQAQDVHSYIRGLVAEMMGGEVAERTRIQYGGSVKPSNAGELFGQPDIDGGLIGGASLDAGSFAEIVRASLP